MEVLAKAGLLHQGAGGILDAPGELLVAVTAQAAGSRPTAA